MTSTTKTKLANLVAARDDIQIMLNEKSVEYQRCWEAHHASRGDDYAARLAAKEAHECLLIVTETHATLVAQIEEIGAQS